jgi:hypothetical protein
MGVKSIFLTPFEMTDWVEKADFSTPLRSGRNDAFGVCKKHHKPRHFDRREKSASALAPQRRHTTSFRPQGEICFSVSALTTSPCVISTAGRNLLFRCCRKNVNCVISTAGRNLLFGFCLNNVTLRHFDRREKSAFSLLPQELQPCHFDRRLGRGNKRRSE